MQPRRGYVFTIELLGIGPEGDGTDTDGHAPTCRPFVYHEDARRTLTHEDVVLALVDALHADHEAATVAEAA